MTPRAQIVKLEQELAELEEQLKAKDDYIVKLQLRLMRIEAVAENVHNAFKPGARLPHEQAKALTDLAIAVREQPAGGYNPEVFDQGNDDQPTEEKA